MRTVYNQWTQFEEFPRPDVPNAGTMRFEALAWRGEARGGQKTR